MLRGRLWLQNQDFGASVGAIGMVFRDLSLVLGEWAAANCQPLYATKRGIRNISMSKIRPRQKPLNTGIPLSEPEVVQLSPAKLFGTNSHYFAERMSSTSARSECPAQALSCAS